MIKHKKMVLENYKLVKKLVEDKDVYAVITGVDEKSDAEYITGYVKSKEMDLLEKRL